MRSGDRHTARYIVITVIFCALCVVFLARLINFQILSKDTYAPAGEGSEWVERVYIEAKRGSICDRNGTVLVTDRSVYSIELDYTSVPDTRAEVNALILETLYIIDEKGEDSVLPQSLSPFEGTYPNMTFKEEFTRNLSMYNEFIRLLEKNFVTEDNPLDKVKAENNAESISRYYARKYEIVKEVKTKDGSFSYESEFTDEEISRLIAIRYEMDRLGFDPDKRFVLASDISYELGIYIKEMARKGLVVIESFKRVYNYPGYASHILGLTGKIYAEEWEEYKAKGYDMDATIGRSGCEAAFEDYLRASRGIIDIHRDAEGNVIKTEVIKEVAEEESAIFVGRCADYILRHHPARLSFFIYSDYETRVERVMRENDCPRKEAEDLIAKTDKSRVNYYNFYTGKKWGKHDNYHLAIDSSVLGVEGTAQLLAAAVRAFVKSKGLE